MSFQKKTDGPVSVKFTKPAFRYKGVLYNSAEVEKAAQAGSEEAQAIIANLVSIGASCVEIVEAQVIEEKAPAAEEVIYADDDIAEVKPKKSKKKGNV